MAPTIFAPASGAGKAAVSVVRVSGLKTGALVMTLAGLLPEPRVASLRTLRARSGEVLDQALVLWFPAPRSFTGEDCAEFHLHGSRAVVAAVLDTLARCEDCRLAEPGEFARRAFLNGKMDLAAAEGLADLIDSETEGQRRQALRQLGGALGRQAEDWRSTLLQCQASLEADIDFSDEADVGPFDFSTVIARIDALISELESALSFASHGERLREGFTVVLAGPPNAGKSSLLNALARRDVAIVSAIPGTTRDPVEVELQLGGLPITLVDTAGLRESADEIEREGVRRSLQRAERADLVIWLAEDGSCPDGIVTTAPILMVGSKADLRQVEDRLALSTETGQGIGELLDTLRAHAEASLSGGEQALIVRERHRSLVQAACLSLTRARDLMDQEITGIELIAEDIRSASSALGRISGRIDVEEVLGEIFSRFCIGK